MVMLRTAWLISVPSLLLISACSFFSLEDRDKSGDDDDGPLAGSGPSGSGGTQAGSGNSGSGGSSAGTSPGGAAGSSAGAGGSASGSSGAGGTGGGTAGGGSGGSTGGTAGSGGDGGTDTAGTGGLGGGASGASGDGGSGGSGGSGGTGGGEPTTCEEWNPSAETFAGHCYLVNTTPVTWPLARDACMTLGAHLVTISSDGVGQTEFDAENTFVWGLVNNMELWIGVSDGKMDMEQGGTPFTWVNGEPLTINGWSDGEPNNYQKDCPSGGTCYEHCGLIPSDRNGQWNDEICGSERPYVCEKELDSSTP